MATVGARRFGLCAAFQFLVQFLHLAIKVAIIIFFIFFLVFFIIINAIPSRLGRLASSSSRFHWRMSSMTAMNRSHSIFVSVFKATHSWQAGGFSQNSARKIGLSSGPGGNTSQVIS